MFAIILIAISSLFGEISTSLGKAAVKKRKESIYTMGFLSLFWGVVWFLGLIIFKHKFVFSLASLPTFSIRAVLEIVQAHIGVLAVTRADRSTYSFIRISTMVMLLIVDIILGYSISVYQMLGIFFISLTLLTVFKSPGINKNGLGFVIYTAIGAVATISLFKYDISRFNSIETEQFLIMMILLVYFFVMAIKTKMENPVKLFSKPLFSGRSFSQGLGAVLGSFAYGFAPASIIMAGGRSTAVLFALIFGKIYFKEQNVLLKFSIFIIITTGIFLLII